MTRIEQSAQQAPVNRDEMKQIVRRELFLEIFRRKMLGCLGMLAIFLLVTLIPAGLIVNAAAKSGLVEVPLLSDWMYKPSAPTRVVRPFVGTITEDVLRSVGRHSSFDIRTGIAKVTVTEAELTTIVAEAAVRAGGSMEKGLLNAQVVIEPRTLELFALSPQGDRETTILARLEPTVVKGRIVFEVRSLHVGALAVAPSIAQFGASYISNIIGDALQQELSSAGQILGIDAGVGEMVITLMPSVGAGN